MNSDFCVAVHALVFLNHKASTLSSETLAQNICTHPARVRRVMARLKKAGLVHTKEGADGGYQFLLSPDGVTLRQVADALDLSFVSASWHSGDADKKCLVASGMGGIMDDIFARLDARCRETLGEITIGHIDRRIFHREDGGTAPPCA